MSWTEIASLMSAITAFGAVVMSVYNSTRIHRIHVDLNSRLSQLILASKAEGRIDEQNHQKDIRSKRKQKSAL